MLDDFYKKDRDFLVIILLILAGIGGAVLIILSAIN